MGKPTKGSRAIRARIAVGAFACSTTLSLASALVTPTAGAQSTDGSAAALAAAVANKQSDVDELQLGISALQESVNQSFVDLRDAQARAEQARRAASTASERLGAAQKAVEEARKSLDEITRAQYRGSGQPAVVDTLSGESGQKDTLDRAQYLRQRSAEKRQALEEVERARTQAANEESLAREASQLASDSEADAKRAESETRELLESRQSELASRTAELSAAQAELAGAKDELAKARGGSDAPGTEPAQRADQTRPAKQDAAKQESAKQEEPAKDEPAQQAGAGERRVDGQRVDEGAVKRVQEQVAVLAPEAQAPSQDAVAEALTTAQTAAGTTEYSDEVVGQAASIAAATTLVSESQAPHATFADPYAAGGRFNVNGSNAREIISAFAGGFEEGMDLASQGLGEGKTQNQDGARGSANTAADAGSTTMSASLKSLLPQVETPDTVTEAVKQAVQPAASGSVEAVIARAQSMVGTPYVWGGGDANGPTTGLSGGNVAGFDCSGLVLYAYSAAGISLPHYTGYMYERGTPVDPSQAKRGDLLFWGPGGSQHVAIYLGDGMMIEAPTEGQNVSVVPVRWAGMSPHAVRLL